MIGVLTFLRSQPDRLAQTIDALQNVIVPSLESPGCLAIHLHADPRDACRLMIYEQWVSKTDFDVNGALPQSQWFWRNRSDYLQADIDIQFFDLVADASRDGASVSGPSTGNAQSTPRTQPSGRAEAREP
jgi:quinol monooxygenase YgiN